MSDVVRFVNADGDVVITAHGSAAHRDYLASQPAESASVRPVSRKEGSSGEADSVPAGAESGGAAGVDGPAQGNRRGNRGRRKE